ncbi:MAG: LytTR family transcriptional regulator [Clostridia bacterium]|nr:LytTR family transcriptional regulator [Clostridia bacterium]
MLTFSTFSNHILCDCTTFPTVILCDGIFDAYEQIKEKLNKLITKSEINVVDDAKIVMVEQGFEMQQGKINVVFASIDYIDAFELVNKEPKLSQVGGDTITGFSNNRYVLIPIGNIYLIEAHGNEILCYSDQEIYHLKNNLQHYEVILNPHGIVRINKSQLVNLMNVKEIIPWFNARLVLVLKNNRELEVSKYF